MSRRSLSIVVALALIAWAALAAANLLFGELNQDEGWYLYAARLVSEGNLPFRDFAFTQGPMSPLIYALAHPLVERWGVGGGRLFTALLGLLAAGSAACLASRLAPPDRRGPAAALAFILIAVNVYHSYFTTVVKTYALCAVLLTKGLLAVAMARNRKSALWFAWAGLVLAAAAATRITAGLALATVGLWLLTQRRALGDRAWIAFALGGGAGLWLFLGVFFLLAPDATRFFLIDYHAHREVIGAWGAAALKAGMLSRLAAGYFVAFSLGAGLVLARWTGLARAEGPRDGFVATAWWTLAGIVVVQAAAPFPYDDYQVPLFPVFSALLAAALMRLPALARPTAVRAALWIALALNGAAAASSPINQAWVVVGRDRIWWRMREKPALLQLREAARLIRERSGNAAELLTQDTYLAVESGLRVPPGWEMGIFSYYPQADRRTAERLRVRNRELLLDDISISPARVAALSDYAFSVAAPAVAPLSDDEQRELRGLVESRFKLIETLPDFGQGNTTLRLYARDDEAAP